MCGVKGQTGADMRADSWEKRPSSHICWAVLQKGHGSWVEEGKRGWKNKKRRTGAGEGGSGETEQKQLYRLLQPRIPQRGQSWREMAEQIR